MLENKKRISDSIHRTYAYAFGMSFFGL